MDPNATLTEMVDLANARLRSTIEPEAADPDADRLAELTVSLNDWLLSGGFPPTGVRR
jgi:hypothetical protein